jgi:hypothetical protein
MQLGLDTCVFRAELVTYPPHAKLRGDRFLTDAQTAQTDPLGCHTHSRSFLQTQPHDPQLMVKIVCVCFSACVLLTSDSLPFRN